MSNDLKHDKNHRPIACEGCESKQVESPTMLQAWASDEFLEHYDVDSIDFVTDGDLRRAVGTSTDCSIEGHCYDCNGPDDGTCGDED